MQNYQPKPAQNRWNIIKVLEWTTSYFKSRNIDAPRVTAEILLAHALNFKRIDLYLRYDQPLNTDELSRFKTLIKRRIKREPVAYITGFREFWSMSFAVTSDALIPRPETECLVETAIDILSDDKKQKRILELGTGSGAIICAIANNKCENCNDHISHIFIASDYSVKAISLAQKNAAYHGLACYSSYTNKAEPSVEQKISGCKIFFFAGDWFYPLRPAKSFDMILSNPPYIPTQDIKTLQPEICRYEPLIALDGGSDGLKCIRHIIHSAPAFLEKDGSLILEIGYDQKQAVEKIVSDCGFYRDIRFIKDYGGHDRVVVLKI